MKRSHILIRNVLYNFVGQSWLLILAFLSTPYIVYKLGDAAYGIFTIVTTVIGYFGFLNAGFGAAIVKYVAEFYAQKDFDSIKKTIGTSFVVFGIIGLIGGSLIAILTDLLVKVILHIPENLMHTARFAFYISAIGFLINMPLNIFSAIPRALQRFDIVNKVNIFVGSLQILLTVLLLILGYSLNEIVIMNVLISILSIFIHIFITKRLLNGVSLKPTFHWDLFLKFFKFGGWVGVRQLMQVLVIHLDKFVIGVFLPISELTYYAVPHSLSQRIGLIPSNIMPIMLPAISELGIMNEKYKIKELFIRALRFITVGVLPLCLIIIVYAHQILLFWLGNEFAQKATLTLQILSLSFLFCNLGWLSAVSSQGIDRPDMPAVLYIVQVIIHLCLCFIIIPELGINGAAFSFGLTNSVGAWVLTVFITKKLGIGIYEIVKQAFLKSTITGFFLIFVMLLLKPIVNNVLIFILVCLLSYITYLILAFFMIIDNNDRRTLVDYFSQKWRTVIVR
ncbi:MAG: oligosaccharide flippase family protein [candidate division WOR-3 bacterium]